jgi:hypothetical protein
MMKNENRIPSDADFHSLPTHARHCERSEAIHLSANKKDGLLRRCAPRNDAAGWSERITIGLNPFFCSIRKAPVLSSRPETRMLPRGDIVRDGRAAATAKRLVLDDIEHGGRLVSGRGEDRR